MIKLSSPPSNQDLTIGIYANYSQIPFKLNDINPFIPLKSNPPNITFYKNDDKSLTRNVLFDGHLKGLKEGSYSLHINLYPSHVFQEI